MFSKAKRFEPIATSKSQCKEIKKQETENQKPIIKTSTTTLKAKQQILSTPLKINSDTQSQCSSKQSVKSFVTPKPSTQVPKPLNSAKKTFPLSSKNCCAKSGTSNNDDILKAQEVEIRNKDYTISEYNKQTESLKNKIASLKKQLKEVPNNDVQNLDRKLSQISLDKTDIDSQNKNDYNNIIDHLNNKIQELENQCRKLNQEASSKQVELSSLEEVITIRDSLCKDLQEKLTNVESCLEETRQRLEMVKGHHALALEANASIRREYKAEIESLKLKLEEEKQSIINRYKTEEENVKSEYYLMVESIKKQLSAEKDDIEQELQQKINTKESEMKAKLDQIKEASHEKLKLCEIQFEERSRNLQEHCTQLQKKVNSLEKEANELKYKLNLTEEKTITLQKEVNSLKNENESLKTEKNKLIEETNELKEENKKKNIDFENEINKLTVEVDKVTKEKNKFEMSLSVTRDIVQVLTMRLRESDNELEHLESKVQTLATSKEVLEDELNTYKNSLNNTVMECNEYKEALVNILKSKAALAKEHTRIMEHNVSLIESLQHVEKEAYRELGSIKSELIEDVELLKKESKSQIQMLREEVEKKRMMCELATEHAGQASVAAEQSRLLLAQAASEIAHLEADNQRLQQQIQDQQSLVVELSLLRQENEELTMTVAKQSSMMEKMKKDVEIGQLKPKSPSVIRKINKIDKENIQTIISPLRERNY